MSVKNSSCGLLGARNADWSRETPQCFWDPSRKLLLSVRRYQYWKSRRGVLSVAISKFLVVRHRFWSVVTGADVPLNCRIGGSLVMLHPNGVVIHPDAKIGENCSIFQQVTIGTSGKGGVPTIADCAEIGAGAKVLGEIHIGTSAKIDANSVVLSNVPNNATVVRIPALILH